MPLTPFHFGPCACISLPLRKWIDPAVFLLANVVIDLEPGVAMLFRLDFPLHAYVHSFFLGGTVGLLFGVVIYRFRGFLQRVMNGLRISYEPSFKRMLVSAVLGMWFHVVLDAPLYRDIRPFFPFSANPFYGILPRGTVYLLCAVAFLPAAVLYFMAIRSFMRKANNVG